MSSWRGAGAVLGILVGIAAAGCSQDAASDKPAGYAGSKSCGDCHEKFYGLWSTSFHGLAMQPYTRELAKARLTPQAEEIAAGAYRFRADVAKGRVVERHDGTETTYPITQTMGGKNVFYLLTSLSGGRLQVLPVAYDVRRKEWFDTTASASRHFGDRRDEALYWKDRSLTFNTSCFSCHVSQLATNYDPATDSYQTSWAEPGINCETCHGPSAEHAKLFRALPKGSPPPADIELIVAKTLSHEQRNAMCAPCHAKMSPVTTAFTPGERYFDHFDLVTLDNADFYPDGRDLGENYTYTSWRMSPCAKAGELDCIHCHTSSGRYRFKDEAKANDACLPCHEARVNDAPAHTHHAAGSSGNRCVSCHMPTTEFARMRRSDHSMRPPTPSATIAYGSPNACNVCHADRDAAWADALVRIWRSRDYQKPVLARAALIDAARKEDWNKLPEMLAYLSGPDREEIQTTSLVRLLATCGDDRKWPVLLALKDDPSPLVRAGVAVALGDRLDRANGEALLAATADPSRLVRVRAAASLAAVPEDTLPEPSRAAVRSAAAEFAASMSARPDDMTSHYNLGNFRMARGQPQEAAAEFETAIKLRPDAVPPHVNAALAYNALGRNDTAEASLRRALALDPGNAVANLNLGMLLAELGRMPEAEAAFRTAFQTDPRSAQAAYNLGVMLMDSRPDEAMEWCRKAAEAGPENPRYGSTYAFYLYQAGRFEEGLQAIRPVRARFPADQRSAEMEQALLQARPDK